MADVQISQVDIVILNNVWWRSAFRFGVVSDVSWSFHHKHFLMDLKADREQADPDLSMSSESSPPTIIVDELDQRILHFEVTDTVIREKLSPGPYAYDLVMVDSTTGERDPLMIGTVTVRQGVTIED